MPPHEDCVTFQACETLRTKCRLGWRMMILSIAGLVVPLLIALCAFAYTTARAQSERDTRQDERVSANRVDIERNYLLLREDLKEIKGLLRQRGGQ